MFDEALNMARVARALPNQTTLANFPQLAYPNPMNRNLTIVLLLALACSYLVGCSGIHEVAQSRRVTVRIRENPNFVFSKDTNGWTPLHFAAAYGYTNVVKLLLVNKANVNDKDNDDRTPLHYAAGWGFQCAARPVYPEVPNLHNAAIHGYNGVAELLLADGAEVNAKDNCGDTPLHLAALRGHKDMAELLLTNKAEVNMGDNDGFTPLHLAMATGHRDLVELLLVNKADVNAKNHHGDTPLHCVAEAGSKDMAELLLADGAEVNAKDNKGQTPLHIAAYYGNKELVELFRQHGGHE
jgi:ankyrin repeat protein